MLCLCSPSQHAQVSLRLDIPLPSSRMVSCPRPRFPKDLNLQTGSARMFSSPSLHNLASDAEEQGESSSTQTLPLPDSSLSRFQVSKELKTSDRLQELAERFWPDHTEAAPVMKEFSQFVENPEYE